MSVQPSSRPAVQRSSLTRRDLLRGLGLAGLGGLLGSRRVSPQDVADSIRPGQAPRADRLYDPSVVQERAPATAADNDPIVKAIEQRLKCTCGCNLDVYTCRTTDFTCTYSPALHQEVVALRVEGKSPEQVVEAFVGRYGETILMAPRPEGFNLVGYLVPGAVVTAVALLLGFVLVRRSRRLAAGRLAAGASMGPPSNSGSPGRPAIQQPSRRAAEPPSRPAAEPNPADDERLQRALADIED